MAIKVNGDIVIDDDRSLINVNSIQFGDASVQTTAASPATAGLEVIYNGGQLIHTIDNPNAYGTSSSDWFASSAAISGNYAIVGAYQEDDFGGFTSGKAYIFNVTTGALVHTLDNPNAFSTSGGDNFGRSVAISGNYAIVGADTESDAGGANSGKAYIFNVTTGALVHTLDNPNAYSTSGGDFFGNTLAISGNYAIIGVLSEDDAGGANSGKAYIFNVTTGALVRTLDNPNAFSTAANDNFGNSVAISGNYAIVGAYNEDDADGSGSGKAYIFNVTTGALVYTLDNPDPYGTGIGDYFGFSVAMSGDYAIVGAYAEEDAGGTLSGKAYIYNVTTGALVHTLDNPNAFSTSASDYFGISVGISDNYAVVGAYGEDDAGGSASGKAYIFDVATGTLVHTLDNPNAYSTSANDQFGYTNTIAIDGYYVIVGARWEDDSGGSTSGKAYIFAANDIQRMKNVSEYMLADGRSIKSTNKLFQTYAREKELINTFFHRTTPITLQGYKIASSDRYTIIGDRNSNIAYILNNITGKLIHKLDNPNAFSTTDYDQFGYSVAIDGNYAVVGARDEDDAGSDDSGKAYIFNVTTGALVHTLNNPNAYGTGDFDYFGGSVGISGNYAIVGAYQEDDAGGSESGKAYIFNVTTGALVHTLDNPNAFSTTAADNFGNSVSISGNYAVVGAYYEDDAGGTLSGKVYVFNVATGTLVHTLDNPNAYSTSINDFFGQRVAISGNYAIVGATGEDDAGGTSSGKAYIFNVITGTLVHTLNNPNAFSTSNSDYFGNSVAISGNYAAVGAYFEDDAGGSGSGKVYIFNVTTGALVYRLDNPNHYGISVDDYFGEGVSISNNTITAYSYGEQYVPVYTFALKDLTYLDVLLESVS